MKDSILIRAKDVSLLIMVCTVLGILFTMYKKPYVWDAAAAKIDEIERQENIDKTDLAVIKAQLNLIIYKLDKLK